LCSHDSFTPRPRVVDLEEYYDEYGDFGFRPNRDLIDHPNGRGKVEKRILQASLLQEMRAFNLVVNVVRSRAGNKNYFLIRAPTLSEWAKKVWVPKAVGESDCRGKPVCVSAPDDAFLAPDLRRHDPT